MTNNEAREYFKSKGLDYSILSQKKRDLLREFVRKELKSFRNGQFRMIVRRQNKTKDLRIEDNRITFFGIRAKGFNTMTIKGETKEFVHFDDREAISFNRDGFIGFAGWADSKNVQPFLSAFVKWCDLVSNSQKKSKLAS
jgi:hypothetical protein